MIFLVFAVICGSLFAVVFKLCQKWEIDTGQVILFNYVAASLISLGSILAKSIAGAVPVSAYMIPLQSVLLAVIQGAFFYLGFLVMNRSTWRSGVALTTAAARASLVLPLILSWVVFSQSVPSWVSVGIIIAAMLMMVLPAQSEKHDAKYLSNITDRQRRIKTMLALVAVFFTYGFSDFLLKVVQHSVEKGATSEELMQAGLPLQMLVIFVSASVVSFVACIVTGSFKNDGDHHGQSLHQGFRWRNVLGGIVLGLINTGCTACMLQALGRISTSLFYPLYNVSIVVVSTLVGVIFFKEKLKPIQIAGLVLAAAAIVLMSC